MAPFPTAGRRTRWRLTSVVAAPLVKHPDQREFAIGYVSIALKRAAGEQRAPALAVRQAEYIELIAANVRFRLPCFKVLRSGRHAPPSLRRVPGSKFI